MTPRQAIQQIDKLIDANRALLPIHHGFDDLCAGCWQSLWDHHPDLWAREQELFRQRGIEQERRDTADHKAWQTEQRKQQRNRKLDREAA